MRTRYFSRDGDPITAEDVLSDEELSEYRRHHPRPPMHQITFWPDPEEGDE